MSFQELTRRLWKLCTRPVVEQGLQGRGGGLTPRCSQIPPMDIPRSGGGSSLIWGPQMALNLGNSSRQRGAVSAGGLKGVPVLSAEELCALQQDSLFGRPSHWLCQDYFWVHVDFPAPKRVGDNGREIPDPQIRGRDGPLQMCSQKPSPHLCTFAPSDIIQNTGLMGPEWLGCNGQA